MKQLGLIIFIIGILQISISLKGQKTQDSSKTRTWYIEKERNPVIANAHKLNTYPVIVDTATIKNHFAYDITPKELNQPYEVLPIKPAKIKGWPVDVLQNNYVTLGYGLRNTILGEYCYNSLRTTSGSYGLYAKSFSNSGELDYNSNAGIWDFGVNAFGKKFFDEYVGYGEVFYNRKSIHYYGFEQNDFPSTITADDLKQVYNRVGANFDLSKLKFDTTKINANGKGNYTFFTAGIKEHNANLKINLKKNEQNALMIGEIGAQYANSQGLKDSTQRAVLFINPHIQSQFQSLYFTVGFNIYTGIDNVTKVGVYPYINAKDMPM